MRFVMHARSIAISASALLLLCELVRTWGAGRRARSLVARARRIAAVLVALSAAYIGSSLSPRIIELHNAGIHRGDPELDSIHKRAELVGKFEAVLALGLVALHVFTVRTRAEDEDDEEDDAPAPLPPGPR